MKVTTKRVKIVNSFKIYFFLLFTCYETRHACYKRHLATSLYRLWPVNVNPVEELSYDQFI